MIYLTLRVGGWVATGFDVGELVGLFVGESVLGLLVGESVGFCYMGR